MLPNSAESNAPTCVEIFPPTPPSTQHEAVKLKGRNGVHDKTFTFDQILPQQVNQSHVYQSCVLPLIDSSLQDGYNATVLAYGQTGSGKTYTMMGNENTVPQQHRDGNKDETEESDVFDDWGVIPRALHDIFARLEEEKNNPNNQSFKFEVNLQCVELYGEEIRDLFTTSSSKPTTVKIRDSGESEPEVIGARTVTVSSHKEAMHYIMRGMSHRVVASTNMNAVSSRSHAITTLKITQWTQQNTQQLTRPDDTLANLIVTAATEKDQVEVRHSKIHLVDLAGSESLKRTQAEGE
eukprot:7742811-Ditylum_brightwellii.AAC.1